MLSRAKSSALHLNTSGLSRTILCINLGVKLCPQPLSLIQGVSLARSHSLKKFCFLAPQGPNRQHGRPCGSSHLTYSKYLLPTISLSESENEHDHDQAIYLNMSARSTQLPMLFVCHLLRQAPQERQSLPDPSLINMSGWKLTSSLFPPRS